MMGHPCLIKESGKNVPVRARPLFMHGNVACPGEAEEDDPV